MVKPGWLAIYGREAIAGEGTLVAVGEHEKATVSDIEVRDLSTKTTGQIYRSHSAFCDGRRWQAD